ncbi:MAG: transcription elongation factor GreAB [Akkermansiaceae bacterium]
MKRDLVELIVAELRQRLDRLVRAARAAHEAATDPDSKAESKYDTRSLEESYLATGQARQVKELEATLVALENFEPSEFDADEKIAAGALVKVKSERGGEEMFFFLAPASGGLEIDFEGKEVTLLSPESPLYQNLLGERAGAVLEAPPFRIVAVL